MAYKPIKLPSASAPAISQARIEDFLGVDFTNQPSNVDEVRSPDATNMIRDVPGKVRKRMGWHTVGKVTGRVNGWHELYEKPPLVHAGTILYKLPLGMSGIEDEGGAPVQLYDGMADDRSSSWELAGKLYIVDGKALLVYDGETVQTAQSLARVPILSIAKPPAGGGQPYEDLNLLQPKFEEDFLGDGTAKVYQLSFGELDDTPVEVQILQSDGTWKPMEEDSGFSVNRETGQVTFTTAPGKSPVSGQDNVKITASRTVEGYADRINKCRTGILFGVNGAADRLFLTRNPDAAFIHYDWYSGQNDPAYWGDTAYATLGQSDSPIVGYSIVNARLAAHKSATANERNVIVREGNLQDSKPSFPIVNMLQGEGAVGPYSFAYLTTEPLFLTRLGLYALTTADVTGEKYAQNRSFYLNGRLLEEPGLEDAFALVYKDMYWLAINEQVYILDGLQPVSTDRSAPYSTRQYAGFYLTNVPARVLWQEDGVLYFGSKDGSLRAFYTDPETLTSYSDDGAPIYACWRTPDLQGKNFYRNKTFSRFSVELAAAVATSVRALARVEGIWEERFFDDTSARYFDWSRLDWSKWTWSSDDTPRTISEKIRLKKVDKAGFKVENDALNEPFGIENLSMEFVETGYYR